MITKLLKVLLVAALCAANVAPSRLQVTQLRGFGASEQTNPILYEYVQRCYRNGGTFDGRSANIARNLIAHMAPRSYWPKLKYLYPFLGSNLLAAIQPLKYIAANGNPAPQNFNYVNGDYTLATGLQGNGTNKTLQIGLPGFLSSLGTGGNGGMGWWENNINFGGTGSEVMGGGNSANTVRFSIDLRPAVTFGWWSASGGLVTYSSGSVNGDYYMQRANSTSRTLYLNGSSVATSSASDAASGLGDLPTLLGASRYSASVFYWAGRCAAAYFTDGTLTTQEITDLHSDLQTYLITPTGR